MMAKEGRVNLPVSAWMLFVGVIVLLIGIYASVRTAVNLVAFDKYPQSGVLTISFSGNLPYSQREQDCLYPRLYYEEDLVTIREPTDRERAREKEDQKLCLEGVREAREQAKINDISQSALFLFLGAGLLIIRRIIF